jgi:hypothetical protein
VLIDWIGWIDKTGYRADFHGGILSGLGGTGKMKDGSLGVIEVSTSFNIAAEGQPSGRGYKRQAVSQQPFNWSVSTSPY